MSTSREQLYALVCAATDPAGRAWLDAAVTGVCAAAGPAACGETLLQLFPAARRQLGAGRLTAAGADIETADGRVGLNAWSPGDAGRALLLLDAVQQDGGADLVATVYRAGDEAERISVTRALSLLGNGVVLKPLALQTGRANSAVLFAAVALDNPFPSAHYSDHEFNQLVLKSLFIGLPLEPIVGLAARANADLSRMCEDYFEERTAAGRAVPTDIWLALAPHASEQGLRLLREHVEHADAAHRHFATRALKDRNAVK